MSVTHIIRRRWIGPQDVEEQVVAGPTYPKWALQSGNLVDGLNVATNAPMHAQDAIVDQCCYGHPLEEEVETPPSSQAGLLSAEPLYAFMQESIARVDLW